jgi:hypothetical protein
MATFVEELRKGFRFVGYGEAGEKFTITGDDKVVVRFLPVIVLGKSFNFRVDTEEAYAALPSAGTVLLLQGRLRRRKNSVEGLSGELTELITAGKPGWKAPSDSDILAGLHFEGYGLVSRKASGVHLGNAYSNVQVASWGSTLVFKHFAEGVFDRILDESQSYFSGSLDSKVVNSGTYVTDELIPEIQQYRIHEEKAVGGAKPPQAEKPAA